MKPLAILTVLCWMLAGVVFAQEPAQEAATPPAAPEVAPAAAEAKPDVEPPPAPETFDARVRRMLDEFDQRHEQRELEMASYAKAAGSEATLERLADPRKVEVELKDEEDREQTSQALAKEYNEQAQKIQASQQALQDFINKRRQRVDDLNKPTSNVDRQDLEIAAANLARQSGTEAQVHEINRRLADAARDEQVLPGKRAQAQQEAASAEEELAKLQAVQKSLEKESKAYSADATAAHENRLALADRLEFLAVSAQAEDVLDQGKKAVARVQHLSASPEVVDTLQTPNPRAKTDAKPAKTTTSSPAAGESVPEQAAPTAKE